MAGKLGGREAKRLGGREAGRSADLSSLKPPSFIAYKLPGIL
jgi:hypothetical protein